MSHTMTAEEVFACELINYIEAKPDHWAGLCAYFSGAHDIEGTDITTPKGEALIEGWAYDMIDMVRGKALRRYGSGTYVDSAKGATPTRVKFAESLLRLVTSGRLFFDGDDWQLRP